MNPDTPLQETKLSELTEPLAVLVLREEVTQLKNWHVFKTYEEVLKESQAKIDEAVRRKAEEEAAHAIRQQKIASLEEAIETLLKKAQP